jgi:lysyl-tRNA synthetase class 2
MRNISIPRLLGRLAYFVGFFEIASNIDPALRGSTKRVAKYLPVFINSTAFAATIFLGFAIMVIGRGLIRRKRRAWYLMMIILISELAVLIIRDRLHPFQIIVVASLVALLIIYRKEFYAISDPLTKLAPLLAFLSAAVIVIIIGTLLIALRNGDSIIGHPTFIQIVQTVLEGLVGVAGPVQFTSERVSDIIGITLATLGVSTLIFPLFYFFRRVTPTSKLTNEDVELIKQLISRDQDQDSLGYFATRKDKSVIWSNNKKAGIAYRVQSGVMLASGDPFGEYSLWPEVIKNFLEVARMHAWTPAVMGASDTGGEVWVETAEMLAIDIGDEAIIKVKDFTLEGRPMANVRQMVNRIRRKGYETTTCKFVELAPEVQAELRQLAKKWRYGAAERGFSMSMDRFGEVEDSEAVITIARKEGEIKGLLYFVPWITNRLSLDRMQRDRDSDAGVNDLLIVSTVEWAKENGYTDISLNFAAFRSLFERADKISAGPVVRSTRNIIRLFSNWFQVESLYRFNAKFQPEWRTRYVLYPKAGDLVRVGWSALRAEKFIQSFRTKSVSKH